MWHYKEENAFKGYYPIINELVTGASGYPKLFIDSKGQKGLKTGYQTLISINVLRLLNKFRKNKIFKKYIKLLQIFH